MMFTEGKKALIGIEKLNKIESRRKFLVSTRR